MLGGAGGIGGIEGLDWWIGGWFGMVWDVCMFIY